MEKALQANPQSCLELEELKRRWQHVQSQVVVWVVERDYCVHCVCNICSRYTRQPCLETARFQNSALSGDLRQYQTMCTLLIILLIHHYQLQRSLTSYQCVIFFGLNTSPLGKLSTIVLWSRLKDTQNMLELGENQLSNSHEQVRLHAYLDANDSYVLRLPGWRK